MSGKLYNRFVEPNDRRSCIISKMQEKMKDRSCINNVGENNW